MSIYFDNNATTKCCAAAKKAMNYWVDRACNPSTDSGDGHLAKVMIEKFKEYVLKHCGVSAKKYSVIITSGGSESNSFIVSSCMRSYHRETGIIGHIVVSAIEHKSILETCRVMFEAGELEYSIAEPNKYGEIGVGEVEKCIKKNTCLVSIMYANNELGTLNDIEAIGSLCHKRNIPFHTDAVQAFGKYKMDLSRGKIDAVSVSCHKFYSGMGVGLLILSKKLIDGYKLCPIINGTQQGGLRGGTEDVAGIAGAAAGLRDTFDGRMSKNKHLWDLCVRMIEGLGKVIVIKDIDGKIVAGGKDAFVNIGSVYITLLGVPWSKRPQWSLPNTLLISVVKVGGEPFCNVKLKKFLCSGSDPMYVSIGSACNTSSKNASHVLTAIGASSAVKQGTIRISFGDTNTKSEVDKFLVKFIKGIKKQIKFK